MQIKVTVGWLSAVLIWLGGVGTAQSADYLEPEILAYEEQDRLFPPSKEAIVVTGSSTINWWYSMRNDLAPLDVIPRGFGGSTADDLDHYLERIVLKYEPRAVVIYEGDNDLAWGATPGYIADRISQISGRISARFPNARVYVISVKPSPLRWSLWPQMQQTNRLLAEFCATDLRYHYIDTTSVLLGADGLPRPEYYASDALHLSAAGYAAWTGAVRPVLMAREQSSIGVPTLQGQDIGAVGLSGSFSESGGVLTVRGSGDDVWGTSDEFQFTWLPLTGDGQITARLASQTNTAPSAKAGVMLREQLTANSRHAFMFVTPAAGSYLLYRLVTGGTTGLSSSTQSGIAAPYWVRLVRQGNVVTGYNSPNGITWTLRGSVTFSSLPGTVYIGLAVSSLNDGVLGTAVFDNVFVAGSTSPPPPPVVDVTPPTVPTGLQVTAAGSDQINYDGTMAVGTRVFDVSTERARVVDDLDIFAISS
jgi:lysophospholipase L1-like esterase